MRFKLGIGKSPGKTARGFSAGVKRARRQSEKMNVGKIQESVLRRSVFRQLKTKREEVLCGAGPGEDCAILSFPPGEELLVSSAASVRTGRDAALYGIHTAVNNLAACGGRPAAVWLTVLLPPEAEEEELRALMMQAEHVCAGLNIQIAGGHTEVTSAVNRTALSVTAVGSAPPGQAIRTSGLHPGAELVVTKWVGLEGTAVAAKEKEQELLTRFPAYLVEEAKGFDRYLSVLPDASAALKADTGKGICAMTDVSEGGIFGAFWKMGESSGVGLEIDLKKIPIRQETVEICNHLDLNPYELISGGSLLIAADDGYALAESLEKEGIPAAVVGRATAGNDRIVWNGEEKRFLGPVRMDEIHKLI